MCDGTRKVKSDDDNQIVLFFKNACVMATKKRA